MMILSALTIVPMTASAAATTVTWTSSKMDDIFLNYDYGAMESGNTIGGITVTGSKGVNWMNTYCIDLGSGAGGSFTFTSSVGDISSIVISAQTISVEGLSTGWSATSTALSWSGTPAASVTLSASSGGTIYTISQIVFTIGTNAYTVTWNNWDGTELEKDTDVEEGATPAYDGVTPTKAEDNNNTYEFAGWTNGTTTYGLNDALPSVTGDVTYTAVFEAISKDPCAKGHSYGEPAWFWADDLSTAKATFVCDGCKESTTLDAEVTNEGYIYTAKVTIGGKEYTDTQDNTPALENTSYAVNESVKVGERIEIAGSAEGGAAPVTYQYFFKRSENTKWNTIKPATDAGTYAKFTPTKAASYDIKVTATDADGVCVSKIFTIESVDEL